MSTENINNVENNAPPANKIDEAALYSEAMQILEIDSNRLEPYKKAKELLEQIPNYRNAQKLLADCDAKIESIRRHIDAQKRKKAKTLRNVILAIIVVIVGAIAVGAMATANSQEQKDFETAMATLKKAEADGGESKYTVAYNALTKLGDYNNAGVIVMENYYKRVKSLADEAKYSEAFKLLDKSYDAEAFKYATPEMINDVNDYLATTIFNDANGKFDAGDYYHALDLYGYLNTENPEIIAKMDDCKFQGIATAKVGDVVKYGSYEVDADTCDYTDSVDWLVLAKEGNKFLLITNEVIDARAYNREYKVTDWNSCSLRAWLNGEFVAKAFSESELSKIVKTAGDTAFLLTVDEASKYFAEGTGAATLTPFAMEKGAMSLEEEGIAAGWWLMNTSAEGDAAVVDAKGNVCTDGYNVSKKTIGVRPAIWVEFN